jgi:hypothetical protein
MANTNPFAATGQSTRAGYVTSSGQVTQSYAEAQKDAEKYKTTAPAPSSTPKGFKSGGGGGATATPTSASSGASSGFNVPTAQSTRQGYVLSSGEVTQDRARAEADAARVAAGAAVTQNVAAPSVQRQNTVFQQVTPGTSTREGYVLSSGEVTQSRERAEADVSKASTVKTSVITAKPTQRQVSTLPGYVLRSGEFSRDTTAAQIEAKELALRDVYVQRQQKPPMNVNFQGFTSTPGKNLAREADLKRRQRSIEKEIYFLKGGGSKYDEDLLTPWDKLKRTGYAYQEFGENIYRFRPLKGIAVSEKYRGTYLGDIATFISRPAGAAATALLPAVPQLLTWSTAIGGFTGKALLFGGAYGAGTASSYYGGMGLYRGLQSRVPRTQEERAQTERLIQDIGETTQFKSKRYQEFENIGEASQNLRLKATEKGREYGLTGDELNDFVEQNVYSGERQMIQQYYGFQGYKPEEISDIEKAYRTTENIKPKEFNVPLVGNVLNPKQLLYDLPGGFSFFGGFKKETEQVLSKEKTRLLLEGKTEAEAEAIINKQRTLIKASGEEEAAGIFSGEFFSQVTGTAFTKNYFGQLANEGVKLTGSKQIERKLVGVGFIQGVAASGAEATPGYTIYTETRGIPRSQKDYLITSGVAAVTAGTLSAGTIGFQTTKPAISKVSQVVGYGIDPQELLFDEFLWRGISKAAKIKEPSVFISKPSGTIIVSSTKTESGTKTEIKIPDVKDQTLSFAREGKTAKTEQPSTLIPGFSLTEGLSVPVNTQKPSSKTPSAFGYVTTGTVTNIPNEPNIPNQPDIPVPEKPDIPSPKIPTPSNTGIPSVTNIFNNIPVNVPVNTPLFRIPPPIPLLPQWNFGQGGGGQGGKRGTAYINELAFGGALLRGLVSSQKQQVEITGFKRKKTKKAKKTKRGGFVELVF